MNEKLEEIVKELLSLGKSKPLPSKETSRAKELMKKLREMSFTNKETSELTDGAWGESSAKAYTSGARVRDPDPKKKATELLVELVNRNLSLDDVQQTLSIRKSVETRGLSFDEVPIFLEETKKHKVDLKSFLDVYKELENSGMTVEQLSEQLSYKSELDKLGVKLDGLKTIIETTKLYGDYDKVFSALRTYGNLKDLMKDVEKLKDEKSKLDEEINESKRILENLKSEEKKTDENLKLYRRLEKDNFDYDALTKLKEASEKFKGFKEVLDAINTYKSLEGLQTINSKLNDEKKKIEADLKSLEVNLAHLGGIKSLCEALLYKHSFSIEAIENLYKIANKYGNPYEVLKLIGEYGDLEAIKKDIGKFSIEKNELESRLKELKSQIQELRGTAAELNTSTKNMLSLASTKITEGAERMEKIFTNTVDAMSKDLTQSTKDTEKTLAKTVADATSIFSNAVDNLKKVSIDLGNVYSKAIDEITKESLNAGKLLERTEELKRKMDYEVIPLFSLIKNPAEVKESPKAVLKLALAYTSALQVYTKVNESKIPNYYSLKTGLEKVQDELVKSVKD